MIGVKKRGKVCEILVEKNRTIDTPFLDFALAFFCHISLIKLHKCWAKCTSY